MIIRFPVFSTDNGTRKKQKTQNSKQDNISAQDMLQYPADFGRKLLIAQMSNLSGNIRLYNEIQELTIQIENLKLRIENETDFEKKQDLILKLNQKLKSLNELKNQLEE